MVRIKFTDKIVSNNSKRTLAVLSIFLSTNRFFLPYLLHKISYLWRRSIQWITFYYAKWKLQFNGNRARMSYSLEKFDFQGFIECVICDLVTDWDWRLPFQKLLSQLNKVWIANSLAHFEVWRDWVTNRCKSWSCYSQLKTWRLTRGEACGLKCGVSNPSFVLLHFYCGWKVKLKFFL